MLLSGVLGSVDPIGDGQEGGELVTRAGLIARRRRPARERAARFAAQTTDPAAAVYIQALAVDPSRGPTALAAAWRRALAAAVTPEQIRRALYQLAAIGQLADADIAVAEGCGAVSPEAVTVLTARNDAAGVLDLTVNRPAFRGLSHVSHRAGSFRGEWTTMK